MEKYKAIKLKYAIWCGLSKQEKGEIDSDRKFSEKWGCHYNSLQLWKNEPGWAELKQKAAWYLMENTNHVVLSKTRELVEKEQEIRGIAEYTRWIFPLVASAKAAGWFDEFEDNAEKDAFLPEEIVQQQLAKFPVAEQMHFVELLKTLDYLKSEQAIVPTTDDTTDLLEGLITPLEEREKIYTNPTHRRRKVQEKIKQLNAPTSIQRARKRHLKPTSGEEIEL